MKKMKKTLSAITALSLLSGIVGVYTVRTAANENESDRVFAATVSAISGIDGVNISATRKPLYDIDVQPLGYVYEYELCGEPGYALIVNEKSGAVPMEVMPGVKSPYEHCEGKCIYVNGYNYLEYANGNFMDVRTGDVVSSYDICGMRYGATYGEDVAALDISQEEVTISYESKTEDKSTMAERCPQFSSASYVSACANIAGANVLGFFDRYHEDLIPDHEAGFESLGLYFYNNEDAAVYEVISQLHSDMNTTSEGTTMENFISGMEKFCARKGRNISFTHCFASSKLRFSILRSNILNKRPIVFFLSGYHIAQRAYTDNIDGYRYHFYSDNHIMTGFGYRDITYTYSSGESENVQLIYVSTGSVYEPTGYLNINYKCNVDDAYALNIY